MKSSARLAVNGWLKVKLLISYELDYALPYKDISDKSPAFYIFISYDLRNSGTTTFYFYGRGDASVAVNAAQHTQNAGAALLGQKGSAFIMPANISKVLNI